MDLLEKQEELEKHLVEEWGRQAGYIAAAGLFALKNNINRLEEDHSNILKIVEALKKSKSVSSILPIETNIVFFDLSEEYNVNEYLSKLKDNGILALGTGGQRIRFVTHLGISNEMVGKVCGVV